MVYLRYVVWFSAEGVRAFPELIFHTLTRSFVPLRLNGFFLSSFALSLLPDCRHSACARHWFWSPFECLRFERAQHSKMSQLPHVQFLLPTILNSHEEIVKKRTSEPVQFALKRNKAQRLCDGPNLQKEHSLILIDGKTHWHLARQLHMSEMRRAKKQHAYEQSSCRPSFHDRQRRATADLNYREHRQLKLSMTFTMPSWLNSLL